APPCVRTSTECTPETVPSDHSRGVSRPPGRLKRGPFRRIESMAVRPASRVITVCDSIGEELERQYRPQRKVAIIRNIPPLAAASGDPPAPLRTQLGLPDSWRVVMYQGGVGPSRNLEPVSRAMAHVPEAAVVIRG